MTLRRADLAFVVATGLVILGVSLLPSPRDQNPRVPNDAEHRVLTVEGTCLHCHAAGASNPLAIPPHPRRTDCIRCHAQAPTG